MNKFTEDFSKLEDLISSLGYNGQWKDEHDKKVFRSEDRAILNWWPSTGTLNVQGPVAPKEKLKEAVTNALSSTPSSTDSAIIVDKPPLSITSGNAADGVSERVFVVYGHDAAACAQLQLVLHLLGLDPFVLGDTSGGGLTIIEALENEILSPSQGKRFGIVLLTPDDMGYKQSDRPENAQPRARQNVVMEMGMLIAAFGRQRVAILKKGHVEVPSDVSGIIYLAFNNHVKETAAKLCQRLREAEFEISPEAIEKATT